MRWRWWKRPGRLNRAERKIEEALTYGDITVHFTDEIALRVSLDDGITTLVTTGYDMPDDYARTLLYTARMAAQMQPRPLQQLTAAAPGAPEQRVTLDASTSDHFADVLAAYFRLIEEPA